MKEVDTRGNIFYNSISMKCPELANPWKQIWLVVVCDWGETGIGSNC